MLKALEAIHAQDAVHGSLSTRRIMFFSDSFSWKLLLTDYTTSQDPRKSLKATAGGSTTKQYDEEDDIVALGIIALQALTHGQLVL